ncbi:MAG TPA: hypothetical protein VND90_10195 [Terracidiphilus sp.]|nr:hypothetical protein [Terracidiphilus sp.]
MQILIADSGCGREKREAKLLLHLRGQGGVRQTSKGLEAGLCSVRIALENQGFLGVFIKRQ